MTIRIIVIFVFVFWTNEVFGHQVDLGKTRQSFIQLFPEIIFEKSVLNDGRSRINGQANELLIEVIGPARGSVEQVTITWGSSQEAQFALMVLKHVFPERRMTYKSWLKKAIKVNQALDIRGGILTTLRSMKLKNGRMFSLTIRPVPDKYTFYNELD